MSGSKLFALMITCCVLSSTLSLHAQNSDEELRAAYIYNFAKYIRWPHEHPNFTIGIYGADPDVESALLITLKGKKIAGKEIVIKTITDNASIGTCHIIYCPDIENKKLSSLLEAISANHVLLVTKEDMIKKGAMISFLIEDEKIKFKLKKDALIKAGLTPADGLLRLAIVL